jgi:DNA-binding protein Fis
MNSFIRCRWLVAGGWRLPFQDIPGKLVVNVLQMMDGLDVWQLYNLVNEQVLQQLWNSLLDLHRTAAQYRFNNTRYRLKAH